MESEIQLMDMNLQARRLLSNGRTGTEHETDKMIRERLKAEVEPSIIRSTSRLQGIWSARLAVAFNNNRVERINHRRF